MRAVGHALAAPGPRAHRAGADSCADGSASRRADRARRQHRRRAHRCGQLSALAGRGSNFELARWLEHDGDGRPVAEVAKGLAFRCDAHGCTARVKGMLLAVANSPAALRDDCTAAAILVVKFRQTKGLRPAGVVIDSGDLAARGAHASHRWRGNPRRDRGRRARNRPWAPQLRREDDYPAEPGDDHWLARWKAVAIDADLTRLASSQIKTGGSARRAGPGCRPGRGRRCASRSRGWRLRARWRRPSCAGA